MTGDKKAKKTSGSKAPASKAGSGRGKVKKVGPVLKGLQDSQSLGRVGAIALFGFIIGIAWPRLAGVSLVPEAPVETPRAAAPPVDEPAAPPVQEAETRELKVEDRIDIAEPKITSCVDTAGKKHQKCGELDTDALVHGVLASLVECPAANGAFGTLSLGFDLNFDDKKVRKVRSGRSTDLPGSVRDEILRCAEDGLASVQLKGKTDYSVYTVFYVLEFKTPQEVIEEGDEVTPASGRATVRWQSALIRSEASRDAKVAARLLSGARVVVTGRKGEWYRVKYDAKGREAWVHGAAIGFKQ